MTLLLPVDPAYALDYLAILLVKRDHGLDVKDDIERVEGLLRAQLGRIFDTVVASREFQLSFLANAAVFDAIEKAHASRIGARRVQEINHQRFLAKQKLQERFWPKSPLTERKTMKSKKRT